MKVDDLMDKISPLAGIPSAEIRLILNADEIYRGDILGQVGVVQGCKVVYI